MSVNKVILIGNLTKEPEVKYMTSGDAVANCSIACNETWKDKSGNKQESVEFINLVFYRRVAEIVGEYCKKGAPIYVEGKIKTRKWDDKEGNTRYSTEVVCHEMKMLGSKDSKPSQDNKPPESNKPTNEQKGGSDNFDDDIPF